MKVTSCKDIVKYLKLNCMPKILLCEDECISICHLLNNITIRFNLFYDNTKYIIEQEIISIKNIDVNIKFILLEDINFNRLAKKYIKIINEIAGGSLRKNILN